MLMTESMTPEDEIATLIKRSREAQKQIENYTQDQVNELITAMVYAVAKDDRAEEIAQFTVDETQLGNYDGKFLKIHRKTRATLMDIIDDRYNKASTIISSQIPVSAWYDIIGEGTIADAILDRIVNSSHRIDLKGESLRKGALKNQ